MLDRLLSIISPHTCCSCGDVGGLLCECCKNDVLENTYLQCIVCLAPTFQQNLCLKCSAHTPYESAWVVGERVGSLKKLIDLHKFERTFAAAKIQAELLATRLPDFPSQITVCYIPDIASHRRQRGYDHMKQIVQMLGKQRGWRVQPLLLRVTALPQRGYTKAERLRRQHGAFRSCGSIETPILLIDDIYTTGATITAGVEALQTVTAQPIYIGIIARQPYESFSK